MLHRFCIAVLALTVAVGWSGTSSAQGTTPIKLTGRFSKPGIARSHRVGDQWTLTADVFDEAGKQAGTLVANGTVTAFNPPDLPTSEVKSTLKLPQGEVYYTATVKYGHRGNQTEASGEPFKTQLSGAMRGEVEIDSGAKLGEFTITLYPSS